MTDAPRVSCAIISVGDEVVSGRITDTNAPWLAQVLERRGVHCRHMETMGDCPDAIAGGLRRWLGQVDLIVVSGGLGPTGDDRTRQALFDVVPDPIERDAQAARALQDRLEAVGVEACPSQLSQADRPATMRSVPNANGTAPGIAGTVESTSIWVLPGPPDELRPMVEHHLLSTVGAEAIGASEEIVLFGMAERPAAGYIEPWLVGDGVRRGSIRATGGLVKIRLDHDDAGLVHREAQSLRAALAPFALPACCSTPADALRLHLEQAGLTVATCESCTGGAIGAALTDRPGASRVFKGGLQTYADEAKVALVGVPADLLGSGGPGAVSEATAKAMAQGARSRLQSDVSVSVTGIAGPDGGTPIKPVGTVWIATACQAQVRARCVRIRGDRARVRTWTIHAACMSLLWHLQGLDVKTQWDVST